MALSIGLTGGIASGKSTASHYFEMLGATIIDSDILARQATAPGTSAYKGIVEHYGKEILLQDGRLDRQALREALFSNPHEKKWLESLIHPVIQTLRQAEIERCETPYCLCVIPLLAEKNLGSGFDRILVIDTLERHQITRGSSRDERPKDEILSIVKQQADRLSRLAIADDILFNNQDFAHLKEQVAVFHEFYSHI